MAERDGSFLHGYWSGHKSTYYTGGTPGWLGARIAEDGQGSQPAPIVLGGPGPPPKTLLGWIAWSLATAAALAFLVAYAYPLFGNVFSGPPRPSGPPAGAEAYNPAPARTVTIGGRHYEMRAPSR